MARPNRTAAALTTEINNTLWLLGRVDEHMAGAEGTATAFWEAYAQGVLNGLRTLDRIRIAAGLPPDPRVSQRLSQSETRTAA